ncbi:MAG: GFA family protein [Rhodospirillaceae bacterium]|nr:GFA family protein [Rhodospirillaceae bacterium]
MESDETASAPITGRCYCGATTITATAPPTAIAYCHCVDCRRSSGAPVAAFAGFDEAAVTFSPNDGQSLSVTPGVERTFCASCGSPLAGRYDYLPGQVYIGLGLLDQADELPPQLHAHASQRLRWLHIDDDLPRVDATSRTHLRDPAG